MSTAATQLRTVATTMSGREMAEASRKTATEAGSATVKKFFEANRGTLEALLPKHFDSERMLKLALGALRTTPKLAAASLSSLLGSVVTCAQLGLEPNTPLGHAYLLPFDKREKQGNQWVTTETQVQVIIGYKGMLDLARRSGQIVSIAAHEVCEGDEFRFAYGLEEELVHRPAMKNRGAVIGFYAVAKLQGGGYSFEFMSVDEVNHIRDKAAEKNRAKKDGSGRPIITGPWADNYVEMGRKTVLRRLFKYLPISIESLAFASAIDGQAVAAPAPLEEVAFDMGQDTPSAVDQETGEIMEPTTAPALAQIAHQPDPERIPQQTAAQAQPEPVRQQVAEPAPAAAAGQWQPSPEELAEIEARERAEAGGLFGEQQQTTQPAPTSRRQRGSMGSIE